MQPTTSQTVPTPSSVPSQAPSQSSPNDRAPVPLDAEALRQVSGGITTAGPTGNW